MAARLRVVVDVSFVVDAALLIARLVLAAFVAWLGRVDPGPSAVGWLGALTAPERLSLGIGATALGLAASMAWLWMQLLRQHGRLLVRVEALEASLAAGGAPLLPSANGHA